MKKADMQKWLKSYQPKEPDLTAHVIRDKIRLGLVRESDITYNLKNPENIIRFIEQTTEDPDHPVFKLQFPLSSSKALTIVAKLNENIKVITAWEVYTPWQRKVGKRWKK